MYDLIVVGGGAAGFFSAINFTEKNKKAKVLILEGSNKLLAKVKISGGGRCNVTHACFDPKELSTYYPRGQKELLGPLHKFQPGDTFEWFENNGISLNIEDDNRVFPSTNSSQTIIDCFLNKAKKLDINILKQKKIADIIINPKYFELSTELEDIFQTKNLLIATGSNAKVWNLLKNHEIKIIEPVPSLFSFKIANNPFSEIPGVSTKCEITYKKNTYLGDLLFTHQGITGPGVLKLSAYKALDFHKVGYKFNCTINWLPDFNRERFYNLWHSEILTNNGNKALKNFKILHLPARLCIALYKLANLKIDQPLKALNSDQVNKLIDVLLNCEISIDGKSTNKAEFVTAGGIDLKEIDFRTMQHKRINHLYFAGEILNIDGITGGFNFQAAWTTAWIASQNMTF